MKYISHKNFVKFLETLGKDYTVYVPLKKGSRRFYGKYAGSMENVVIGEVRPFEPLKIFFTRARETVAEGFGADIPPRADKPFAVVGVKACDLKGFRVQDHVFRDHDFSDPFYVSLREKNLIISSDCTCVVKTCFCLALGIRPYPEENFDINLSEADNGFVVEIGSGKGKETIERSAALFQSAGEEFVARRDKRRERIVSEVEKNIKDNNIPGESFFEGIIERNYDSDIWSDEAKTCVECGACTVICPTCHCFLLYDQKDGERMRRLRVWDSCMLKDYARVAGGANPRDKLWMRLRNRFEKKFDFFPKVADVYACTGCGRCVSACPAGIDIREILKKLVASKQ